MFPIARKYKMSDGSLMDVCMRLLMAANRDIVKLTLYGWNAARVAALTSARDAFSDLPTDAELSGMMSEATAAKNLVRKNAVDHASVEIMLRVSQRFGEGSPTYNRFRANELHTSSDHQCRLVLKRIHRQGTLLLADLASEGLLQDHLDTLDTFITDLDDALLAQDVAIDNRDHAVQARVEAGNAMYAEMVKLGDVGKRVWLNVDESKYNDYVLYPHRGGVEPEEDEQVFESDVQPESVLNLSVTNVQGNETIAANNSGTVPLFVYFSAQPTDLPPASIGPIEPGMELSGTVSEAGFEAGVREYLNVYNPNPTTIGTIEVTVTG